MQQFRKSYRAAASGPSASGAASASSSSSSASIRSATSIKDGRDVKVWEVSSYIKGLGEAIGDAAYESASSDTLNELNYLAAKIVAMEPEELEAFAAALEAKRHCGSVADIVNLTDNISHIDIQPAFDATQYGAFHMNLARDEYADIMNRLETSADPAEQDFFLHIADIEMHIDLAAYEVEIVWRFQDYYRSLQESVV